jgi:hypothetical protein
MPGAKTYQAIGYATYHGGRFYGKAKRAELERQMHRRKQVRGAAVIVGAVAALALGAVVINRRGGRVPTV